MNQAAVEGHVDRYENGRLKGWARRPGADEPVIVEARAGDRVLAYGPAYHPRGDLVASGLDHGRYGFELVFDPLEGEVVEVWARGAGAPLPGGPVICAPGGEPPRGFEGPKDFDPAAGIEGVLEDLGPETIRGWALAPDPRGGPVELDLFDGEQPIMRIVAGAWRNDIEDRRGGDGASGFRRVLPDDLFTGAMRRIDLRLAGGPPVLDRPLELPFPLRAPRPTASERRKARPARDRPDLSVVVVFYNMQREAARTLHSLTRDYQQGIDDLDYEVLCIDNGSAEPMSEAFVTGFGPEFRLFPPSRILPSPCMAMNEAARAAKGRRLAIMIDGAHVLSPGAVAEAMAAMDEAPGAVAALRQWFVGGDQRWLSACGWSRELEDKLFRKIDWPNDGYGLFQISSPMFESPNHWLDGMNESNCLFLDRELFKAIGGMDEAFDEPGAGFANLDLFRRAVDNASGPTVALVGEATFHQFHGGTTTNVTDEVKDALVASYEKTYASLRGVEFESVPAERLRLRGRIRTDQALTARQHLMFPGALSVTDRVRPIPMGEFLDEEAQGYVRTVYIESGKLDEVRWLGEPVGLAPADLTNIQELMRTIAPRRIVLTDDGEGLCRFVADSRDLLGLSACEIVHVRPAHAEGEAGPGVRRITGDMNAAETLAAVREAIGGEGPVMVLYEPAAGDDLPRASLRTYADLVTPESYLVFLRTAVSQPYLGYHRNRRIAASQSLWRGGDFELETRWQYQIVTMCPFGYLRRRP